MDCNRLSDPTTSIGRQADEIIEQGTKWTDLLSELDVRRYRRRDGYPEWHAATAFRPMFLAYLWGKVEGLSLTTIPERLEENPELAAAMGFELDSIPSESTFKPSRLEDDRFEELQSTVETAVEEICKLTADRGSPIGRGPYQLQSTGENDSGPVSERTEQRLLRKGGQEVLEELRTGVFPSISFPRPDDPIYDDEDLITLESLAAINRMAANEAGVRLGDKKNPDAEPDDPFHHDGPSGETLLNAVKQMDVDGITRIINTALQKTYARAKPRLKEHEHDNGSRFGTRAEVAFDVTYVAYYGDRDEMNWVQGAPEDKSYNWCHKFATAVIVGENTHYTVAVRPLGSTEYAATAEYPTRDKSYYIGAVTRDLLSVVNRYVNVRLVYADREFHAADAIYCIQAYNIDYVIPARKDRHRIGPMCDDFQNLSRGYDEENDTPLYVEKELPIHGAVKNKTSNSKVYTNLVILPPDDDDSTDEEESPQPFITSLDVSDETAIDRRSAKKRIERYNRRGAIETSYSSIKEACAWTTSKEFTVRWFHFAFGCVVYNMWLLVDFLTQERMGVIETRKKPRITLKRFLNWLDDELVTPL